MNKLGDLTYEEFRTIRLRQSVDDLQRLIEVLGVHFEGKPTKSDAMPTRAEWDEEVALEEAVEPVEVADHVRVDPPAAKDPDAKAAPAKKKAAARKKVAPAKKKPTVGITTGVASTESSQPFSQGSRFPE